MLAANVFAGFSGWVDEVAEVEEYSVTVAPEDLGLTASHGLLGFHATARGGESFDPAALEAIDNSGNVVNLHTVSHDLPNSTDSVAIVDLAAGDYTLRVQGQGASVGAFQVNVVMSGDVDGDHAHLGL